MFGIDKKHGYTLGDEVGHECLIVRRAVCMEYEVMLIIRVRR
jgi:hypothetical protein